MLVGELSEKIEVEVGFPAGKFGEFGQVVKVIDIFDGAGVEFQGDEMVPLF